MFLIKIGYTNKMRLKEFLEKNNLLIPNYSNFDKKQITIVDLMKLIYSYCGGDMKLTKGSYELKKYVKNKKHIILILSDGTGSNLIDSLSDTSILKENKIKNLITVFPSTTACVLNTIATAEYPDVHGIIGWYSYLREKKINYCPLTFKNRITDFNLKEEGVFSKDVFRIDSVMNKLKRKTVAFFPIKNVNSEFSKYMLKINRIPYENLEDAFEKLATYIINNEEEKTFSYLYLPYIDSLEHAYGVFSKEVRDMVLKIEYEIKKILNKKIDDTEIIFTADHGQIDIFEKGVLMDFKKYDKYFYALPAIDYGTSTFYVKEDKQKEFEKEFKKDFKEKMYLFKTEEFLKNYFFGEHRENFKYLNENLGEYISLCANNTFFINTTWNQFKYLGKIKGNHSGLSKDEMEIPLIIL